MLAAYATCDDYPHNAYPGRFLNFKIYLLFGVHAGIICFGDSRPTLHQNDSTKDTCSRNIKAKLSKLVGLIASNMKHMNHAAFEVSSLY